MPKLLDMRKIYFLKSCDTCKRIIQALPTTEGFVFQDIKEHEITEKQWEEMYQLSGSYEALFSRKAKLYKEMGLKDEVLTEADIKRYLRQHYTFLSRPVIIADQQIFIGSSPKNVQAAIDYLSQ